MNERCHTTPPWLPELVQQVEEGLQHLNADRHDQRPALQQELQQIEETIQGWSASLAKPNLPVAVRETVESQWATAAERQQEIKAELSELSQAGARAEELVRPEQVLDRLDNLADVLAANDPTRGNLELSLHIDRVVCHRDDRVTLRMCKLGIMPDAVGMLCPPVVKPSGNDSPSSKSAKARRRGKLRIVEDDGTVDLQAQAEFIANTDRFAGLGDEWFWIDEFRIPESLSWAAENSEVVFRRRQESRLSYAKLADEFDVTPPTIGAAIRHYLKAHPGERDEVCLPRGGKRPPKFNLAAIGDEARQLWIDGWSKEKLAEKYGCSPPTVVKAIAFAYAQEGKPMPTREEVRRAKVTEARRSFDEGKTLESIVATMKVSVSTVRKLLQESFAADGKTMPDMRSKEHRRR
jgi:hypothetical protein